MDDARYHSATAELETVEETLAEMGPDDRFRYLYLRAYIARQLEDPESELRYLYLAAAALKHATNVPSRARTWVEEALQARQANTP